MRSILDVVRAHLIIKISIPIAVLLFACIFVFSYYRIGYEHRFAENTLVTSADRVCSTVRLGLHYSMMLNSRDDIRAIISNYSRLREIREIRLLNKQGMVMFTDHPSQTNARVEKSDPLCLVCHRDPDPILHPLLTERIYSDSTSSGEHILRLASPIYNEPGCSDGTACHFHRPEEKVLGVLDIAFSMSEGDALIEKTKNHTLLLAASLFGTIFVGLFVLLLFLVKQPISRIIAEAETLAKGRKPERPAVSQSDEIGRLGHAIHNMGCALIDQQSQLVLQKDLYQDLFEGVPCLVTVQGRDLRLQRFNRTFAELFSAKVGEHCYKAYKNLDAPCPSCPVQKTFETGRSQTTEETGWYKDGTRAHWIVTTAPIRDAEGNVVAAMEMNLDITSRKDLEGELKRSEKKYHDIFNNIPSAVFLLSQDDFSILDCNKSAATLYGYMKSELLGMSFLDLFSAGDKKALIGKIKSYTTINQAKHVSKDGREFFVSINSSPSEASGRTVYLVTASDITAWLETEQQLIQASKMATLGEMATGVAHELNQPLSVIQTSIDLIRRNLSRGEIPAKPLLDRITELVGTHIERATKIIGHMREFGRKSGVSLEPVDLNTVLARATEFFSQQLTLHGIELVWDLDERPVPVMAEPIRMEQVFVNILINARDAIDEHAHAKPGAPKRISIKTMHNREYVTVRISDTGPGVPPAIADKLFEPFFTTKPVGKGTGLGLSISYGIVQECGGTISVTNNETGGASFFIRIPVAKKV